MSREIYGLPAQFFIILIFLLIIVALYFIMNAGDQNGIVGLINTIKGVYG